MSCIVTFRRPHRHPDLFPVLPSAEAGPPGYTPLPPDAFRAVFLHSSGGGAALGDEGRLDGLALPAGEDPVARRESIQHAFDLRPDPAVGAAGEPF